MHRSEIMQLGSKVFIIFFSSSLVFTGCFLFPSSGFHNALKVEGRVLTSHDSTAVEGAQVFVKNEALSATKDTDYSDELGEFSCYWSKLTESNEDDRYWVVSVVDTDGDLNGRFAFMDTVLVEVNPSQNGSTEWELDFYVVME